MEIINQTAGSLDLGETRESIKLTKNTRGYNWDIKIFISNDDKAALDRLESLNNQMAIRFSGGLNEKE